jgi:hypothetical protein
MNDINVEAFLTELAGRGIRVIADGDDLIATPGRRLTDADCATIRGCKTDILAILRIQILKMELTTGIHSTNPLKA